MSKTVRVFKSSWNGNGLSELNNEIIDRNVERGAVTNIFLDSNILIDIEAAYKTTRRHEILKEAGIIDFLKIVKKNGNKSVFLSPGAAYQEIPISRKEMIDRAFNKFLSDYLPDFTDDPNSVKVKVPDKPEDNFSFSGLPHEYQDLMSCSYASLMAINVIKGMHNLSEYEKFKLYIYYCEKVLDLISLKEVAIARYAFAPEIGVTEEVRNKITNTRNNFCKLKKGAGKGLKESDIIKKISLNGSMDLRLMTVADIVDSTTEDFPFGSRVLDVWIATSDEKFYDFCKACPGVIRSKSGGIMERALDTHEDIKKTSYWNDTLKMFQNKSIERMEKILAEANLSVVTKKALELEEVIDNGDAVSYFEELKNKSIA